MDIQTETLNRILNYIESHATMVLSTAGEESPWAAPVFYVNRGLCMYYLSESNTIHSKNVAANSAVSVVVTEDHWQWQSIQGLQLKGQVFPVTATWEGTKILAAYCRKFPPVKHIFENPGKFKGVISAKWYCVVPDYLKFTDNGRNFGEHLERYVRVDRKTGGYEIMSDATDQ